MISGNHIKYIKLNPYFSIIDHVPVIKEEGTFRWVELCERTVWFKKTERMPEQKSTKPKTKILVCEEYTQIGLVLFSNKLNT